jgi:hypothetical protein
MRDKPAQIDQTKPHLIEHLLVDFFLLGLDKPQRPVARRAGKIKSAKSSRQNQAGKIKLGLATRRRPIKANLPPVGQ